MSLDRVQCPLRLSLHMVVEVTLGEVLVDLEPEDDEIGEIQIKTQPYIFM